MTDLDPTRSAADVAVSDATLNAACAAYDPLTTRSANRDAMREAIAAALRQHNAEASAPESGAGREKVLEERIRVLHENIKNLQAEIDALRSAPRAALQAEPEKAGTSLTPDEEWAKAHGLDVEYMRRLERGEHLNDRFLDGADSVTPSPLPAGAEAGSEGDYASRYEVPLSNRFVCLIDDKEYRVPFDTLSGLQLRTIAFAREGQIIEEGGLGQPDNLIRDDDEVNVVGKRFYIRPDTNWGALPPTKGGQ